MRLAIKVNKFDIKLLTLVFVILQIGMIFRYGFPLFPIGVVGLFLYLVIKQNTIKMPSKTIIPLLLFEVFYLAYVFIFSGYKYSFVKGEIKNIVLTNILLIDFLLVIKSRDDFHIFTNSLMRLIQVLTLFVAILGLTKFILFAGFRISLQMFEYLGPFFSMNSATISDYNFFALGVIIAFIISIHFLKQEKRNILRMYYFVSSFIFFATAVTSSSRRGIVLIALVVVYYLVKSKIKIPRYITKNSFYILSSSFLLLAITLFVAYKKGVITQILHGKFAYVFGRLLDRFATLLGLIVEKKELGETAISTRTYYWQKSMDIFWDYNIVQKIFGNGFDYLAILSNNNLSKLVYPHQPFFAQILFSGIIGGLFLLFFYTYQTALYIRNYKKLFPFFFIWMAMLFFTQFSGNTIFFYKATIIFSFIPVVYYSVK